MINPNMRTVEVKLSRRDVVKLMLLCDSVHGDEFDDIWRLHEWLKFNLDRHDLKWSTVDNKEE